MNKEIEKLIKLSTIRDIEVAIIEAKLDGFIIPEIVDEIIKEVEASYKTNLDPVIINELTEKN